MQWFSNSLATVCFFYNSFLCIIYTFWLKRTTSLNIVIGGAAGAIPPIIGWTAVVPELSFYQLVYLVIFFGRPHFWALSVYRYNDYKNANVPCCQM